MAQHSTDIEELFLHAAGLDGAEREAFVREVSHRDGELGSMLSELLFADQEEEQRVPEDPRLTAAQEAVRHAMEDQEPVELDAGSREILERVSRRGDAGARYTVRGEVGRGGMGAVLEVWDEELQRKLAMKVVLDPGTMTETSAASSITIARFVEEAQVTGQLDHPGIVPVHELGLDENKRVFFTMRYVRGRPLDDVLTLVQEEREGWTVVRLLGVLQKVCEAMAYAHSKGVIHRDLKPANIMVGRFGEVYVMDWGVARVLGDEVEERGHGPEPERASGADTVRTARAKGRDDGTADPMLTRDGSILGTPYYMPAEQAAGDLEKVDTRADIYAVGAMLYQVLTGHMPYRVKGQRQHPHAILARVLGGPPRPIQELAPGASAELSAICNKAMAREREDRYADMMALSDDLRAYLENRVVRAYATGPLVELRKWILRNKAVATAGILAFLLMLAGGAVSFLQWKRLQAEEEARDLKVFLEYNEMEENALRIQTSEMWPVTPDKIPIYDQWLDRMTDWLEGGEQIREKLAKRREGGRVTYHVAPEAYEIEHLQELAQGKSHLEDIAEASLEVWSFDDPEEVWLHNQMARLVRKIGTYEDPESGLIHGTSLEHGWGVAKRRAWAERVERESVTGDEARELWQLAIEEIAIHPDYQGLVIEPQLGLFPLGPGPDSGLWEFCLLQTGEAPPRDEEGFLELAPETGLVFVLVPGGRFIMGSQNRNRSGPNFDLGATTDEGPPHEVVLHPYFLSKYEMNEAQWQRLTRDPTPRRGVPWYPVDRVRWGGALRVLAWIGCTLPTEAQWEYAARAGTDTPWWTGRDVEDLQGAGNIADLSFEEQPLLDNKEVTRIKDGEPFAAMAYAFRANPYGFHGMIGNVWEWCLDGDTKDYCRWRPLSEDVDCASGERLVYFGGLRTVSSTSLETWLAGSLGLWLSLIHVGYDAYPVKDRLVLPKERKVVARGGSYTNAAKLARHANRIYFTPDFLGHRIGIRPARKIEGEIYYER